MKVLRTDNQIENFLGVTPLQSISIRVTQACNLKCCHCYATAGVPNENELTTKELKKLLNAAKNLGAIRVFFGGGEPFLRKDIIDLYKYAKGQKYAVYTSTNGTIVTEKQIEELSRLDIKIFQISIDGTDATHDRIRGVEGTYVKAVNTLKLVKRYFKKTKIVWAFTLMKHNKSEVIKAFDLATAYGADVFALIPLFPAGRMHNNDDISTYEKNKVLKEICEYCKLKNIEVKEKLTKLPYLSILSSPGVIPIATKSIEFGCGFVCTFPNILGIDSNGDVYPCDGLIGDKSMYLGNVRTQSLKAIWLHPIMTKLRSIDYRKLEGVCRKCIYMDLCMGGCRAYAYKKDNNYFVSDPLCQEFYNKGVFPKGNLIAQKGAL